LVNSAEAAIVAGAEDAEVRPLADYPPDMQPLALILKLSGPFMLFRPQPIDRLDINIVGNAHCHAHLEQHDGRLKRS
jgi:hypothetical protein